MTEKEDGSSAPASRRSRGGLSPAVVFSCLGHLYIHFCTAFYFVIVLTLEREWSRPYHELIPLWTLGSLLVGLGALPAGLLSDRVGAARMMVAFFLGMGGASILAGLTSSTGALVVALGALGLFAAIYHPVGIPWLVKNQTSGRGKALGVNGIFGSAGSALAGVLTGALIDLSGWRAAFIVPGVVSCLTGLVLVVFIMLGRTDESPASVRKEKTADSGDGRRVFAILLVTMFAAGLIFHATQTSLPKLLELRSGGLAGEGVLGVGLLVALVYGAAGIMQVMGGHLADRFPLKPVYVGAVLLQVPLLWAASALAGMPLVVVATLMVMANTGALPAENMLLARHTPESRHGLVFGSKFVLSFGAAPLAVALVSLISARTGSVASIYVLLAACALFAFLAAALLPADRGTETMTLTDAALPPTIEETTQI